MVRVQVTKNNGYVYSVMYEPTTQMNIDKCEILLESIIHTNLLSGAKIYKTVEKDVGSRLYFYASSVDSLASFSFSSSSSSSSYSYDLVLCMLKCLITQYKFIEKNNYAFYSLSLEDIYVIDGSTFLFFNPKWMKCLDENKNMNFHSPFERNPFCSPELLSVNTIPCSINSKSFYYSLGLLSTLSAFRKGEVKDCDFSIYENNEDMIDEVLKTIYKTKLYWFIKKNVNTIIQDRNLLLI
jgi:hypothetical protein